MRTVLVAAAIAAMSSAPAFAQRPLVTGDVPTAHPGVLEVFLGYRHHDTGTIHRQIPHVELVYGVNDRWEVQLEGNYISRARRDGLDDLTLAAKVVLIPESQRRAGFGFSYDLKLANGDAEAGIGSGGIEQDFRLRAQKTFGLLTLIGNVGFIWVEDVEIGGQTLARRDVWRASLAQEWKVSEKTKLLTEIYWRTSDEPGGAARLAWNAGFKHKVREDLAVHAAVGRSLRGRSEGGPKLRVYAGVKLEFH